MGRLGFREGEWGDWHLGKESGENEVEGKEDGENGV